MQKGKKNHAQSMMKIRTKKKKEEKREKPKDSPCPKEREKGERWNHTEGVHTPFHHIPSTHLHILIRLYDLYSTWIWSLALQHM